MTSNFYLLYIDPGTGSLLAQAIIAAIVGVIFYFKNFIFKTRLLLGKTKQYSFKLFKRGWLHPLLVCTAFILFKIKSEFILFNTLDVLLYLLVFLSAAILLYFFLLFLIKDENKSGIIVSVFILLFLFYEPLYEFLRSFSVIKNYFSNTGFIIYFFFGLIGFLSWRTKRSLSALTSYLNVLFFCLIIYEGGLTTENYFKYSAQKKYIEENNFKKATQSIPNLPNIYYIVFDSYTSSSSLKKYFDSGNNGIDSFLLSKGFYCVRNAKSKFHDTHKSIASVFNMENEPNLDSIFSDEVLSTEVYSRNIKCSKVAKELAAQNYRFINLSFFDIGNEKHFYDNLWMPSPNYLAAFLLRYSRLAPYFVNAADDTYKMDLVILDSLKKIPQHYSGDKLFVYAHLSITHGSFYFDRNGKIFKDGRGPFPGNDKKNYLESVMYANAQLMKIVEAIQSSKTPSVIIVQGDHGSRFFERVKGDQEKYTIFSSCFFPDKDYSLLNDSISPVNSFKVLFGKYFHKP